MKSNRTMAKFEEYLNEGGVPSSELKSNGGRIVSTSKYGTWLRRNDPIMFNEEYYNWLDRFRR